MIACTVESLGVKDEQRLRKWLLDGAGEIFLQALRSEQAVEEANAIESIQKQADEVCRGAAIPPSAMIHLRKAATISAAIKLIESKMKVDSILISAKPTIL